MLDTTDSSHRYEDRLKRVTHYIHDHLDEPLDLIKLADVAAMSPYHWHRIYSAVFGETVFQTVSRLLLQRAAWQLVSENKPITAIARQAGYASLAPFSRAFARSYGVPPGRYRSLKQNPAKSIDANPRRSTMHHVNIRHEPAFRLATVAHQGPYMQISRAFTELFGAVMSRGLYVPSMQMRAVYFDDPDSIEPEKLRSLAGIVVDEGFSMVAPFQEFRMQPTRLAVLTHKGPYVELRGSYDWMYGQWLPGSGEETANLPPFEAYLNSPMDTAPADLLTEICVPLKG